MGPAAVRYAMKPVGEPDAGNRHVRFDERGWETERLAQPQATALILDSTALNPGLLVLFKSWTCVVAGLVAATPRFRRRARSHSLPSHAATRCGSANRATSVAN